MRMLEAFWGRIEMGIRSQVPSRKCDNVYTFDRLRSDMSTSPVCPKCNSEYTYQDGQMYVCPECAHEWVPAAPVASDEREPERVVCDAHGNVLKDGDAVIVIKDLPVKGASSALKAGTKVKGIRLVEGDHNIDCKIEGFGGMKLKSEFVKKA
jgi:protein PhnA